MQKANTMSTNNLRRLNKFALIRAISKKNITNQGQKEELG